jgi:exonuclease VII large subunit
MIGVLFCFRYKNGQEIQAGGRYSVFHDQNGNYSLVISDALPQDSGSYEITIRNQYGTANSKTNLQILGWFSFLFFHCFFLL